MVVVAVILFLMVVASLILIYCTHFLRRKKLISLPVLKSEVEESQRRADYYLLAKDEVSADGSYDEPVDALLPGTDPEVSGLLHPCETMMAANSWW